MLTLPADRISRIACVVIALELIGLTVGLLLHGPLTDLGIYQLGANAGYSGADQLYQARDAATGLYFTYPPFAALLFGPAALMSQAIAAVALTLASVVGLARIAVLIARGLDRPQWWANPSVILAFGLVGEPTISTLVYGQINVLLVALVVEDLLGPRRRISGMLIGIATGIKLVPGLFILLVLLGRDRVVAVTAIAAAAGTVAIGAAVLPSSTWTYFTGAAFDLERVGGTSYITNQSVNGMIWRLSGDTANRPAWMVLAALVVIAGLLVAVPLWQQQDRLGAAAVTGLAALLVSPISWSHHWIWILLLVPWLMKRAAERSGSLRIAHLVLAGAWVVAVWGWLIQLVPRGDGRESTATGVVWLVGNSYCLLGLVTVALLVVDRLVGSRRAVAA